jgi:hypothetical protein
MDPYLFHDPFLDLDSETDPDMDPETDLELDPEKDPETDWELDPDSWQSALRIAKSVVTFATGLLQFHNKLRNCQASGILLSNFYIFYGHFHCGNLLSSGRRLPRSA